MCDTNPYTKGSVEFEVWELCIRRDIEAFLAKDWGICSNDFLEEGFVGWHANYQSNPQNWEIAFDSLQSYGRS